MKTYWKQKDGTLIDIDYMSIEHLRNTLKKIVRDNLPKKSIGNAPFSDDEIKSITPQSQHEWDELENLWK